MKRWVMLRSISPEMLPDIDDLLPPPAEPWYFQTRRGGLYRALPPFDRRTSHEYAMEYNLVTVADRSADAKYLRPGTKEWAIARQAVLA